MPNGINNDAQKPLIYDYKVAVHGNKYGIQMPDGSLGRAKDFGEQLKTEISEEAEHAKRITLCSCYSADGFFSNAQTVANVTGLPTFGYRGPTNIERGPDGAERFEPHTGMRAAFENAGNSVRHQTNGRCNLL